MLIVEQDTDPVDPRVDCDTFGHMVCWHRRYLLGDGHHYETPWDCLRDLCSGCVQDDDVLDDMGIDDLKAVLTRQTDIVILPVYLYDHSGFVMATGSFVSRAFHAGWDSGQMGFIYATREDIHTYDISRELYIRSILNNSAVIIQHIEARNNLDGDTHTMIDQETDAEAAADTLSTRPDCADGDEGIDTVIAEYEPLKLPYDFDLIPARIAVRDNVYHRHARMIVSQ